MAHQASWIDYHAARTPEKIALQDFGTETSTSYAQLRGRVDRLAGHLAGRGIGKGDRVALLARNNSRSFELLYACARVGAILVPVNWRLALAELVAILADFAPSLLVHDQYNARAAADLAHESGGVARLWWADGGGPYEEAIVQAGPVAPLSGLDDEDPWVIIYTSGTTGLPKGAVHTFASVTANIDNSAYAGAVGPNSVSLTVLPTFHVAGLHLYANAALMRGGTAIILEVFDPETTLQLFQSKDMGVTHFCGVPANFQIMSDLPGYATANFLPIQAAVGGSPVPAAMVDEWRGRGVKMMSIYGITEAGSSLLAMPPRGSDGKSAVGIPVFHAEVSVRGADSARLAHGEIGELWLRGPMVMKEYWNRPEATGEAVDDEGWLHTGDAALCDEDGIFHIVDRWKDMYISGGENIYPAEIENVLYQHPDVVLASVVGVSDEKWGEVGYAFVVLRAGRTSADLASWCRSKLASFKVPSHFEIVDDLPLNATGKIQKNVLKASVTS